MNFYLKYRPQKIAELDLDPVRQQLGEILAAKSRPHAFLFCGPKGTGKTSAARIVAKAFNCLKPKGAEPCNHCDSCQAITRGTALDVLEIDAASNRGIDDIRDLKEKIRLMPVAGRCKIYIIDEVHMLTKEAFNALLKTLEEPPAHAVLVLATTEPDKLPETIISRCLVLCFDKATPAQLLRSLARVVKAEKLEIGGDSLQQLIEAADGSFRDAVKLLEQLALTGRKIAAKRVEALLRGGFNPRQLDDWLRLLYRRQTKAALNWLQQAWAAGVRPRQLLLDSIERLRRVLLFRLGAGGEDLAGIDDLAGLKALILRLILAADELKSSPVESLPLELVVAEWGGPTQESGSSNPVPVRPANGQEVLSKWPQVLAAVKAVNFSLEALLRAAEPAGFDHGFLLIKVFYRFHKDRLEEERYRSLVEQTISKVLVTPVKVRFYLCAKQDSDIISTAEEVFGIKSGGD